VRYKGSTADGASCVVEVFETSRGMPAITFNGYAYHNNPRGYKGEGDNQVRKWRCERSSGANRKMAVVRESELGVVRQVGITFSALPGRRRMRPCCRQLPTAITTIRLTRAACSST